MIRDHPLKNYLRNIGQSQYTKETFESLQQRFSKFKGTYHLLLFLKYLTDVSLTINLAIPPSFQFNIRSVNQGTESISHLGLKIWEIVSNEIKELLSLNSCIKNVIIKWKPSNCPS